MEVYVQRRKLVQKSLDKDDIAIFVSANSVIKSNDVHHRFRQDSDFYYLTGFAEEESALVILPERTILYLRKRDPEKETWNGVMLGVDRAVATLQVDEARDITDFKKDLPELLKKKETLHFMYGRDRDLDWTIFELCDRLLRRSRAGDFGPSRVTHSAKLLHEMRLIKGPEEIAIMKECASITEDAHIALLKQTKPGMFEYELEAMIQDAFRKRNATEAYPSIVASGKNACILHHILNDRKIGLDELVLVDAGAEKNYMNGDVTRTFPSGKTFTGPQKDAYTVVLDAQKKAIARSVVGSTIEDVHNQTVRDLTQGLIDLKVLSGGVDENVEKGTFRKFYMHRTGHWLGIDVHDVGSYNVDGKPRKLEVGMICTVEPGLYFPDDSTVPESFRSIGIRIEDDIVIQGQAPLVLTDSIPKEIDQIELLRAGV